MMIARLMKRLLLASGTAITVEAKYERERIEAERKRAEEERPQPNRQREAEQSA